MKKKRLVFVLVTVLLIAVVVLYRYQQRCLAWSANKEIQAGGVKLMMTDSEVRSLFGQEEGHVPGFGGYILRYASRGVELTFLNDSATDFYNKVSEIKVTDPAHQIFGVRVGQTTEAAVEQFRRHGFTKGRPGWSGYWKMNLFVDAEIGESGKVSAITVGIKDRVAAKRVY